MESTSDPSVFKDRPLYKLGIIAHDHARMVFAVALIVCLSLGSLGVFLTPDWAESFGEGDLESTTVFGILGDSFGDVDSDNTEIFYILVNSDLSYDDPIIKSAIESTLETLVKDPSVSVTYPWAVDSGNLSQFVSDDGRWSRTLVQITLPRTEAKSLLIDNWKSMADVASAAEGDFDLWITGNLAVDSTFDMRLKDDLIKSELGAAPLVGIVLIVVFGSLIASVLPLGVGALTVLSAIGITVWLSTLDGIPVNNFASNIITLLGLGVSIDYSLFMIYRYREELAAGHDTRTAIAITTATAGRAVFFSGLTVAVGLLGLLFFENTGTPSIGIGGTLGVSMAMLTSVIMLPSIFALLGPRINSIRIPFGMKDTVAEDGFWSWIATQVMNRPLVILVPILIVLVGVGTPFLQAEYGVSSIRSLPPDDMAREGLEEMSSIWVESSDNSLLFLVEFGDEDVLSEENLRGVHAYASSLMQSESVISVLAPGYFDPSMNATSVVQFWNTPDEYLTPEQIGLRESLRESFISQKTNHTYLLITLGVEWNTNEARNFVDDLRNDREDNKIELFSAPKESILIGGLAAYNLDVLDAVVDNLPVAIAFIFISTCILLFIQVRSVIIPFKAIVMNILSITATFGMLVFVFQEGSLGLDEIMNFTPQPIDPTTPVMLFCIVFGLSMDYEVLMLSRIHEEWERTGDNTLAVANGLQKTGRLVTAAALIMMLVFAAQIFASVAIIKQFGLGLALAIFVDATLVRALVVPATMRLMGPLNWWAPSFLQRKSNNDDEDDSAEIGP